MTTLGPVPSEVILVSAQHLLHLLDLERSESDRRLSLWSRWRMAVARAGLRSSIYILKASLRSAHTPAVPDAVSQPSKFSVSVESRPWTAEEIAFIEGLGRPIVRNPRVP
jgi:hypothetical protein